MKKLIFSLMLFLSLAFNAKANTTIVINNNTGCLSTPTLTMWSAAFPSPNPPFFGGGACTAPSATFPCLVDISQVSIDGNTIVVSVGSLGTGTFSFGTCLTLRTYSWTYNTTTTCTGSTVNQLIITLN